MTLLHGLRGERRRQSRFEPLLDGLELVPASVSRSPTSRVAGTERAAHVASALRRIPLDHQLALELFYWEDLSMEEIAVALGIATGTVKSRLARAREYLRAQLAVAASVDMGAAMRTAQPP